MDANHAQGIAIGGCIVPHDTHPHGPIYTPDNNHGPFHFPDTHSGHHIPGGGCFPPPGEIGGSAFHPHPIPSGNEIGGGFFPPPADHNSGNVLLPM